MNRGTVAVHTSGTTDTQSALLPLPSLPITDGAVEACTRSLTVYPVSSPSLPSPITPSQTTIPYTPAEACSTQSTTRSEEHTSELQSRGLISYAVFCLKKKN